MPLRLLLITLLQFFMIAYAKGGDTASTLKEVQLPSADKGKLHLSAVVTASFMRSDDGIQLELSFSGKLVHETFMRAITFYVVDDEPGYLLILDAHDSNEDTLHIYELSGGRLYRLTINHPGDDDYIHQHFKVLAASDHTIRCQENEYAGSNPPRQREVTIQFSSSRITCRRAKWSKDE